MKVIKDTDALADLCRRLRQDSYVTVDTEFLRENTYYPKLCLIQLASEGAEAIVDPLEDRIDLSPFYELMADRGVVKVFHAARQDVEIVHVQAGLIPTPLFDTQVAAMVCGFGDSIGYVNLVKTITNVSLDKGARFTDWSQRPLSQKQLTYALADVTHLRDVYKVLRAELDRTDREAWLAEEMATLTAPETYTTRPGDAWQRLKFKAKNRRAMAILMELAEWRERTAQHLDVPRARVLKDDALYDLANQAPTTTAELAQMRSFSNGFERSQRGQELLSVIKSGLERALDGVPSPKNGRQGSPSDAALVDLLKVLLKASAARSRVAAKMLADTEDLERLATEEAPDIPALRGWRRRLFGDDALRLKRGEIALSVRDGEVVVTPLAPASEL
ncbi:MAG: ribonuclease D [Hyphomicrobiaceae bacterium]